MKLLPDEKYYTKEKTGTFEKYANAVHWKKHREGQGIKCVIEGRDDGWWALHEYKPLFDFEVKEIIVKERGKVFGYVPVLVWD